VRWRALRQAGAELALDVRRVGPNEPTVPAGIGAARQVVKVDATTAQRRRKSTSPARGTTSVSGSAAKSGTSMLAGSR
jgi:hypothetical protein